MRFAVWVRGDIRLTVRTGGPSLPGKVVIKATPDDFLGIRKPTSRHGRLISLQKPMAPSYLLTIMRVDKQKFLIVLRPSEIGRGVLPESWRMPNDLQFAGVALLPKPFVPKYSAKMPLAQRDLDQCMIRLEGRRRHA
jgi:hypothetical protein